MSHLCKTRRLHSGNLPSFSQRDWRGQAAGYGGPVAVAVAFAVVVAVDSSSSSSSSSSKLATRCKANRQHTYGGPRYHLQRKLAEFHSMETKGDLEFFGFRSVYRYNADSSPGKARALENPVQLGCLPIRPVG